MSPICEAIRTRCLLEFDYHGLPRVVAPYCHGVSNRGIEVLRGVQVRGRSHTAMRIGKLWIIAELERLRVSNEIFEPDDPHYNPDDSAMREIHCQV